MTESDFEMIKQYWTSLWFSVVFVGVGARASGLKTRVEGTGWVGERWRDPMD